MRVSSSTGSRSSSRCGPNCPSAAFLLAALGQFLITGIEFLGVWALFDRFGHLHSWSLPEVAVFYGLVNCTFACADALSRGFDQFGALYIKTGQLDRLLLRPRSTLLQLAGHELALRRIGRLGQGLIVLIWAASVLNVEWSLARVSLVLFTILGGACLFFGLIIMQATLVDYPLSSRLDENDAIIVFDQALIPWENVFVYENVDKGTTLLSEIGFLPRAMFHGCTRLAVKLDFIIGLVLKAIETVGITESRNVQATVGEMIAWRNLFWGLSDAMARAPVPWAGTAVLPNPEYGEAYRVLSNVAYPRIKELIESFLASGLIYLNSHAVDFQTPALRPYLDRYLRGSDGAAASERVKLMKLLWDAVGTEFGGRHELYERNYAGNSELIRVQTLQSARERGQIDHFKSFAEQCMAEYGLDGWTVPDLINPHDVNHWSAIFRS